MNEDIAQKYFKRRVKTECTCGDWSHRLVWELYDWEDEMPPEVYVYLMNGESSIWWRIKTAWRIIWHGTDSFSDLCISASDFFDMFSGLAWLYSDLRDVTDRIERGDENGEQRGIHDE